LDKIDELKDILKAVGPQNIWRPVVVNGEHLLADGIGEAGDGLAENMGNLDFKGKTVLDLGCNFGYYSFLVRSAGARRVLGIDADARIIRGCEIITALNRVDGVAFLAIDIVKAEGIGMFDIGLMIDLIGRQMIGTGSAKAVLDSLESLSEKEMVLTLRPRYHIPKKLAGDVQGLKEKYPADYIRDNHFQAFEYVRDRFKANWEATVISAQSDPEVEYKQTLHFVRRTPAPPSSSRPSQKVVFMQQ
jgi:tRNA (mo5U34)-methyltransferase